MSAIAVGDIGKTVQARLDQNQPSNFRLVVDARGIRQDGDWWYVTVTPDRNGVRAYDYASLLSEMEERLKDEQQLKILLVPALVDD